MLFSIVGRIWKARDTWLTAVFLGISIYCVVLLHGIRDLRPGAPMM